MSKTLTSKVDTAIAQTITRPRLLIEIGWSATVRLSTAEAVTWNGYTWAQSGARVERIGSTGGTNAALTLSLPNHSAAYGAIALSEGLADIPVSIWALYGASPFVAADGVKLFDGQMNGGSITLERVTINCIAMRAATMFAPRLSLQPPVCNHLLPTGAVLSWNGDTYILERR